MFLFKAKTKKSWNNYLHSLAVRLCLIKTTRNAWNTNFKYFRLIMVYIKNFYLKNNIIYILIF